MKDTKKALEGLRHHRKLWVEELADDACSRYSVSTFVVWNGDRLLPVSISHKDGKRGRR